MDDRLAHTVLVGQGLVASFDIDDRQPATPSLHDTKPALGCHSPGSSYNGKVGLAQYTSVDGIAR